MARRIKKPASRGSVNNIILEVLMDGDKYGYEIIKEIDEKSDGKIQLKQPSLYSSLNRFEDKGFVSSYWQDSAIGGKRHYYCITPLGKKYYTNNVFKNDDDLLDDSNDENDYVEDYMENNDTDFEIDSNDNESIDNMKNETINKYGKIDVSEKLNSLLSKAVATNKIDKPENNNLNNNNNYNNSNSVPIQNKQNINSLSALSAMLQKNRLQKINIERSQNLKNNQANILQEIDNDLNVEQNSKVILTNEINISEESSDTSIDNDVQNISHDDNFQENNISSNNAFSYVDKIQNNLELNKDVLNDVNNVNAIDEEYSNINNESLDTPNKAITQTISNDEIYNNQDIDNESEDIYGSYTSETNNLENDQPNNVVSVQETALEENLNQNDLADNDTQNFSYSDDEVDSNKEMSNNYNKYENRVISNYDASLKEPSQRNNLSLLQQQRKKESMEILYGVQSGMFSNNAEQNNANRISENIERVNLEGINDFKKNLFSNDAEVQQSKEEYSIRPTTPLIKENEEIDNSKSITDNLENQPKYIIDENGILKIRPTYNTNTKTQIIDNVGERISIKPSIYGGISENKNINNSFQKTNTEIVSKTDVEPLDPIDEEERLKKVSTFNERFENVINNELSNKPNYKIDYKNILGDLYAKNGEVNYPKDYANQNDTVETKEINAFKNNINDTNAFFADEDSCKDDFVQYNENNPEYTALIPIPPANQKNINVKKYNDEEDSDIDYNFILSNKAKFAVGWIVLFYMLIVNTIYMLIAKNMDILFERDYLVIGIGVGLSIAVGLFLILPFIINKNKRKNFSFKFGYAFMFGLLSFLILTIIIFAVNILFGLTIETINYYITSLILPVALSSVCIVIPISYAIVCKFKSMYL